MKSDIKYRSGVVSIFIFIALFSGLQSWAGSNEKEKKIRKKPYDRQRRSAIIPGDQTSKNLREADLNHKLNGMTLTSPSPIPK